MSDEFIVVVWDADGMEEVRGFGPLSSVREP
jgi:hypothetical protein